MKYYLSIIFLAGLFFLYPIKKVIIRDTPTEDTLLHFSYLSDTIPCGQFDINFDDPNICVWCGDCFYWMYKKRPYTEMFWETYYDISGNLRL